MFPQALKDAIRQHPAITVQARRLLATVPLSLRLGRNFWTWYAFFGESEKWSATQLQDYQLQQLQQLLAQLTRTSEFYRQRLQPVNTLKEFSATVPALTRSEFREHYRQLVSTELRRQRIKRHQTSGTTGQALQFYHAANDDAREWAAICHQWSRVGYEPATSRRAEFRGLTAPGKLVEVFPEQQMIRCSILHLRAEHLRHYADAIRQHGTTFYHGYPSALYLLAREICDHNLEFPMPVAVLLASEQVYDWQVAAIERAFPQAKIFAHYGCAERTVLAAWCEQRREYHVLPQYSLVEVDPANREIIGTNLFNTINGFVRFRMGDTALKTDAQPCPDCGRADSPRLLELGGRAEDYLYSPARGWIPPAIVTYALKSLRAIRELQIVQRERDSLRVRYLLPGDENEATIRERDEIAAGLRHLFGPDMQINFERVDGFPRTATGKFRWIVCGLDEKLGKET